jgi:hypothetical protein
MESDNSELPIQIMHVSHFLKFIERDDFEKFFARHKLLLPPVDASAVITMSFSRRAKQSGVFAGSVLHFVLFPSIGSNDHVYPLI